MSKKGIILSIFVGLLSFTAVNAQADSAATSADSEAECKKWRGLYFQYLKQKMYADAATMWGNAVNSCGEGNLDAKFYTNGRVIYSKLIRENKGNDVRVKELKDTMQWIYESKMKLEDDPKWTADYASMLVAEKDERHGKIDTLFANSIHRLQENAKSTHIKQYFKHLIINKFNKAPQEEKEAVRSTVIEEYIVLSDYSGKALKKAKEANDEKNQKRYEGCQQFLDKYFLKIAKDCAVLTPVLDKKFETLPEEKEARVAEVNKFMALLEKQKCTDSDTYEKYVRASVELDPTAAGYFGLGNVLSTKGDSKGAVDAFKKARDMEAEGENKDKYQFAYATSLYKAGSYKSAFSEAKKVQGDDRPKAMEICAGSIVKLANSCGESTFERKANYWLANDYIKKAGGSSSKYLDSAPSDEEIFNEGKSKGATITLSCWGESTTIR
ncbi:MAG: importin-beta N-terminal domain-containing protein [Flavobacteriales bacterium]|nr:importin-beta N-terminal domain-containing protein [Flavobacteriales bacterium]